MRRLLAAADLPITATAACVPLAYGHSSSVTVETTRPLTVPEARSILEEAPGIVVEDDPQTFAVSVRHPCERPG